MTLAAGRLGSLIVELDKTIARVGDNNDDDDDDDEKEKEEAVAVSS